jgi:AbrB family looped-hinge helix DNA binding protein
MQLFRKGNKEAPDLAVEGAGTGRASGDVKFLLAGVRMMKITSKGQVTIPQEIRERMGLLPDTEVEFVVRGNVVQLVKARASSRGARVVAAIRGRAKSGMSTDEIMRLTRG